MLIKNHREKIVSALNGHNARVFSGVEYIYVVQLTEMTKTNLIKDFYYGLFDGPKGGFKQYLYPNKIAINDIEHPAEIVIDGAYKLADNNMSADTKKELETIFDEVWLMPIEPKKSKFNCKTQGEFKGKTYESELTAYIRGAGRITVEFLNAIVNSEIAVIFKDANGNYRLLFDPVYSVETDVEQDSGEGLASDAGFTVSFKNQSKFPPLWLYGRFNVICDFDEDGKPVSLAEVCTVRRKDDPLYIAKSTYTIAENNHPEGGI